MSARPAFPPARIRQRRFLGEGKRKLDRAGDTLPYQRLKTKLDANSADRSCQSPHTQ
ncbi:MAG: hypothetical protein WKF52_04395 [Sphingomicrobium sp.]